jgi:hypothetical protein
LNSKQSSVLRTARRTTAARFLAWAREIREILSDGETVSLGSDRYILEVQARRLEAIARRLAASTRVRS